MVRAGFLGIGGKTRTLTVSFRDGIARAVSRTDAGGMTAAEARGRPWATVAYSPFFFRGLGCDVRGPGLRPPTGLFTHFWHDLVRTRVRRVQAPRLKIVNALRLAYGLPKLFALEDIYLLPRLTLATTVEPFEYPRSDWPGSLRFIGPLHWDPVGGSSAQIPLQEASDARPLVLVAASSIAGDKRESQWANDVIDALAEEPYRVIATLPAGRCRDLPRNARAYSYLSHTQTLPLAACLVCHGGPGVTQKALSFGVPVLAIPSAHDRFEVARRVEVAKAGVMLPAGHLTHRRLRRAVKRTIASKDGAQRVANSFLTAGGAPAGADAVEALLRSV